MASSSAEYMDVVGCRMNLRRNTFLWRMLFIGSLFWKRRCKCEWSGQGGIEGHC